MFTTRGAGATPVGRGSVRGVAQRRQPAPPAGAAFNPLTYASWHTAFWAEDSGWSHPADGAGVSSWRDGSGNGRDATQATSGFQPLYRAAYAGLNGQPAVQSDGVDDRLETALFTDVAVTYTRVLVFQINTLSSAEHAIASGRRNAGGVSGLFAANVTPTWAVYNGSTVTGGTADTSGHFAVITYGSSGLLELDGSTVISGSFGTRGQGGISMFAAYGGGSVAAAAIAFHGLIAGTLTAGQKADLLDWSQTHYGTP